jgi:hypothetical protein
MEKSTKRTHFNIGFYALAFLDLLNQKNVLDKMGNLPNTETEKKEYIELLKETVGTIRDFRQAFNTFFEAMKKGKSISSDNNKLSDKQKHALQKYLYSEIKSQYFSDTVIFYTPLSDYSKSLPISDVYDLLSMTAAVFLITLSSGIVSRGSIVVGVGTDFFENEIYGPALRNAYKLESEVAKYPRIVLDGNLIEKINEDINIEPKNSEEKLKKRIAEKCLNFITTDVDGVLILDYLGKEIKNYEFDFSPVILEAFRFVQNSLKTFYQENNYKLISRYSLLENYFQVRIEKFWK